MYFVHPQIKPNLENLKNLFFSFFEKPNEKLLEKLKSFFPEREIIFTDMGRTAFKLIVEIFTLKNSEILFPAFICDIFFPIFEEYNLKPVFLDIDKSTFNIKIEEVSKKITKKTKAIFLCHTFGLPVNVKEIRKILGNKVLIIEDCAHSFGAKLNGIYSGNFGEAAFFSLYKQFPCQRGGIAVFKIRNSKFKIRNDLTKTNFNLRDFISFLNSFSFFAFLFKKFAGEIAPKMIKKEKLKKLAQINRISLNLFLNSLKDFEENLKKRMELALFFQEELKKLGFETQKSENNVFGYLSALTPKNLNRDKFVKELRRHRIFATRIWREPIILNSEVQRKYNLNLNEFPNTIEVAKRVINFPLQNFYTKKDVEKMLSTIKKLEGFNLCKNLTLL